MCINNDSCACGLPVCAAGACRGPRGPHGPAGSPGRAAAVSVGITQTCPPGANASVVNAGTPQNAILQFCIPRGATGPSGPAGPAGPAGPEGPEGPAGGLGAYGGRYSDTPCTITLAGGAAFPVPLGRTMPALNETYPAANLLAVANAGTYAITYLLTLTALSAPPAAKAAAVAFAVRKNGAVIDSATQSLLLAIGVQNTYSGTAIVTLDAGDTLDMALCSPLAVGISLGEGTNAALTAIQLGA